MLEEVVEDKLRNQKYNEYIKNKIPKTKAWPTLFNAFWVGGLICLIGQGINELLRLIMPNSNQDVLWAYVLIILIFLASFLTAIGVFDKIGAFAGAGTIVPITGFSNSITSSAMEFRHEGIVFGVCVKMFTIAGPVIVTGIVSSVVVGLIYMFI